MLRQADRYGRLSGQAIIEPLTRWDEPMSPQPDRKCSPGGPRGKVVFADDDAAALLAEHLDELGAPSAPGWRQVKQNVSRTVYRGHIGAREIFLKHYHRRSPAHRIARRLGISDAAREMRFMRYLASRGVGTAAPLARMCANGVEWLATAGVADAEVATQWHRRQLELGRDGRMRIQRGIVALAGMTGRMHRAGVVHRDLHCGNILIRDGDDGPDMVLMDLHRAGRRRRLSRRARAANLAQLLHDRYNDTTRTERLRFLKHYMAAAEAEGSIRGWELLIEHFARRHARRQYRSRDRRITKRNRYFWPVKLPGGWRGHVVLASKRNVAGSRAGRITFDVSDWLAALSDPTSLLSTEGAEVVKHSRSSLVLRRLLKVGPHVLDVHVKRRRRKQAWKILLDCFRPARSIRAFKLGHSLLTRQITTALPLAALERRAGPFLLDHILVTETVEGVMLNQFLNTWLSSGKGVAPLDAPRRRRLAQDVLCQLGRVVQRLHDNNFAHRDMKASNMVVQWSGDSIPQIFLIDLDGLRPRRRLGARTRFQGLMRLNVSLLECPSVTHSGRLRMLLGYLRRPGAGRINYKPYWRVLERWGAKKLRQQIKSRRRRQKAFRRPGR